MSDYYIIIGHKLQDFQPKLSVFDLQVVAGALLAAAICIVSHRLRLLATSGSLAAFVVGAAVFGAGGWRAALPLLVFFVTANAWGRWRRAKKRGLAIEKSGPRDASQVAANGALPALFVLLAHFFPDHGKIFYLAYAAAIAEANADTWATEVGAGANEAPRMITTFAPVPAGRSGAISLIGTIAAVAGAVLVGLASTSLFDPGARWPCIATIAVSGIAGALVDSLLGATVQSQKAGAEERGVAWVDNDMVNFLSSLFAAAIAMGVFARF